MMKKIIAVFFVMFFLPVFAETTGTINFTSLNASATTGIYGYTVNLCNATSDCRGLGCYTDYDGTGTGTSSGWCNVTSVTSCYHNGIEFGTGTNICSTNTTYRTCSSGNWSSPANCTSVQSCGNVGGHGNCTGSGSSSSSSSGGFTYGTNRNSSIKITSLPLSFSIVQNTSIMKYVLVKNTGNQTLYNLTLSVLGVDWYSVDPTKINSSAVTHESTFSINFSVPADAEVGAHAITVQALTSNSSVNASGTFTVTVNPSNVTVSSQILPQYDEYESLLTELEANMTRLENSGADVSELKSILLNAKSKILQANRSIESRDYTTAKQLLDDAKGLLDAASAYSTSAAKTDAWLIAAIIVVIGVIALVAYMLYPPKKSTQQKGWLSEPK